jgi:Flp pilus assembly protein TadG
VTRDDDGNAIVEFVWLAVLLMVPLAYLVLAVFRVQAATYAVSSATREAGRAFVTAPSSDDAEALAAVAANLVLRDANLRLDHADLRVRCSADPCLTPGATVDVRIDHDVPLPFLPRFLPGVPATVHVSGRHLEVVDRYRPARP